MPDVDLTREGAHVMTVCNACRYCEQYCPVFPAMELRRTFGASELNYLANLCHNCGECLYACQYAPPHEFAINVPRTLARIRTQSYEQYAWPRALAAAFRHHNVLTGLALAAGLVTVMLGAALAVNGERVLQPGSGGDFYAVMPHEVMVGLFGAVALFVLVALGVGVYRCLGDLELPAEALVASGFSRTEADVVAGGVSRKALGDILTLRNLHATGDDCVTAEEARTPWRRWFHHCTFYGFGLCFASTTVAAIYHTFFGWPAPYPYTSLPVVLGTVGGIGLIVGPVGLWFQRRGRDPDLTDVSQQRLDRSFLVLLFLTSLTGLVLLVLRHQAMMGVLLIVHLGVVLALFLTLPYGKFVHGFYRAVALLKHHAEGGGRSAGH